MAVRAISAPACRRRRSMVTVPDPNDVRHECQLFMSKNFWNLPVNPVWRVPGFMKEGQADNEHSNPVLLPLVPEFTNICISYLQLLHFQKFLLEVVAIGRKNAGWESDTASY